ncbi:hypothetical protein [Hydrogenophaga sp. OTU3427]|uniref:hypothetical protein n=1 Tax=Hydrogenophaga sp. OTU3427 TaxID=3043856 RepID=UPI00313CA1CD
MSSSYLNLVFSRACDGDHAALQRWYNDHIGILWQCDTLQRATLYRRDADLPHEADYICCYAFPDEAGFLHYEHGDAREAARVVIVNGWGRDGVAITARRQFRRAWSQTRRAQPAPLQTVLALRLGAGAWPEVSRWLLDRLHGLLASGAAHSATLMRAVEADDGGGELLLWLGSDAPLPDAHAWLDSAAPGAWGQPPASVERLWTWRGRQVSDWVR